MFFIFEEKNMHLAISGNIGSGKTTLTKKLSEHYKWIANYEDVENNPYSVSYTHLTLPTTLSV